MILSILDLTYTISKGCKEISTESKFLELSLPSVLVDKICINNGFPESRTEMLSLSSNGPFNYSTMRQK